VGGMVEFLEGLEVEGLGLLDFEIDLGTSL
jgi:hypothetical protein